VDSELKKKSEELFADLGLTMSAAFHLFLRKSVEAQGIPFPVTRRPNAETLAAMEECERLLRDPEVKGYRDMDELWGALGI